MHSLALGLIVVFGLVAVVGSLLLLVAAFQESVGWGLACLFLPFASVAFVVSHWERAKTGFLMHVVGFVGLVCGLMLATPRPR